ncbi:hypothetical protein BHM03_00036169 [Ensete ventricosum]|nr:hypothetical protein BHM03_00036169 [Ensete ventricosum]
MTASQRRDQQLWELLGKMMGDWMAVAKVEEKRGAKNVTLIPSVRTPQDSKLGLTSIGDRPSLELYSGSSLPGSRP